MGPSSWSVLQSCSAKVKDIYVTFVAKSYIKYGQLLSFNVKKREWQASFLQNNEALVPTGYTEHKLQQSEKTGH